MANKKEYVVWKNQVLIVDGQLITYSVVISPVLLEEQVRKAARNRGGKSSDGSLRVEITRRDELKRGA
jgi:hypothetical protein